MQLETVLVASVLILHLTAAQARICGTSGDNDGEFTCTDAGRIFDVSKERTVCPDNLCTEDFCCKPTKCSNSGNNHGHHVCEDKSLLFNIGTSDQDCPKSGCSDATCCKTPHAKITHSADGGGDDAIVPMKVWIPAVIILACACVCLCVLNDKKPTGRTPGGDNDTHHSSDEDDVEMTTSSKRGGAELVGRTAVLDDDAA